MKKWKKHKKNFLKWRATTRKRMKELSRERKWNKTKRVEKRYKKIREARGETICWKRENGKKQSKKEWMNIWSRI